uniref:Brevican core protein n=1 Tax=Magallana gigas TaxID=29159 RepID=K1PKW8_MAGGI
MEPAIEKCVEGWVTYGGHDYMLNSTKLSQPEAMYVISAEPTLLKLRTQRRMTGLTKHCTFKYDCTTWIGGNDRETEGNFTWETSNTPFIYVNWDGINPDNKYDFSKPVDCVDMFYNGQWNDRPCNFQASFICER